LHSFLPFWSLRTVEVVLPVANSVLLVEAGVVGARVRNPPSFGVAHVEDLAVVLDVGVEADGPVRAIKRKSGIVYVDPSLADLVVALTKNKTEG
jgi:hypothetical protein